MTEPDYIKEISDIEPILEVDGKFTSLEQAQQHYDHLSKQIDLLAKQIMYLFPDSPSEYWGIGACGAAMMLIQDYYELIERGA